MEIQRWDDKEITHEAEESQLYLISSMHCGVIQVDMPPGGTYAATQLDPRPVTQFDTLDGGKQSIAISVDGQVLLLKRQDE